MKNSSSGPLPDPRTGGVMKVTTKTLASKLNLSHATVSMALREHPLINKKTRLRVQTLARELNYTPNGIARAMRSSVTKTIAILVGTMSVSFTSEIVDAIESEGKKEDYQCILCQSHDSMIALQKEIQLLAERRVDGMIIHPFNTLQDPELLRTLSGLSMPYVFYDGFVEGSEGSCVLSDNISIGRIATEYLIKIGHRDIAYITGPAESLNARERYQGYRNALKDAGIPFDKALIEQRGWFLDDGAAGANALLERGKSFTAVVAASDLCAIGAIKALRKHQINVPRDVSIVGSGDCSVATLFEPALTTVNQDTKELGRQAVQLLMKRLRQPDAPRENVTINCDLIIRDTTAPCPATSAAFAERVA